MVTMYVLSFKDEIQNCLFQYQYLYPSFQLQVGPYT